MEDNGDPAPYSRLQAARDGVVLLAILVEGGLVALALALGWMVDQPALARFALDWLAAAWGAAAAGPMLAAFFVVNRWPVGPLRGVKAFSEQVVRPLMAPCTLTDLVGISCLAGLGEEMLFRGVIQDGMAAWMPGWPAIWAASVVFGLVHAVTPSYALLATLMGAYLGWLFVATENLLAPMVTHALYDLVVLVYLLRGPGSEQVTAVEDEEGQGEDAE